MSRFAFILALSLLLCSFRANAQKPMRLRLEDSIDMALKNNRRRPASKMSVDIAQAQHAQALSTYWPQVAVKSALSRLDDDPLFIFPQETSIYTISDVLPTAIHTTVTIPEKKIKLLDKTHFTSALDITYPLYMGGYRAGITRQTRAGIEAAKQEVRRTDLQIVYDVKRFYFGGLLSRELVHIGKDALARLEVTLELTENLNKRGSGKVTKTDFLKHKMVVESVRSILAKLENNAVLARAALVNTLGLAWRTPVELADPEIPFDPVQIDLEALVTGAYRFNPDWARLHAGLNAAQGKVQEAKSGGRPTLALLAIWNSSATPTIQAS